MLVGGVNSAVRAFRAVGGTPRFIARAEGAYMWDVENRRYIDYLGSWGPMIVGHSHPKVVAAVREAVGPHIALAIDFHHRLSPVEAAAPLYVGPETPPSAVPSAASPVLPENVQWNGGYMAAPEVYGYTYPTQDMAEWQQQHQPQQSIHHHPQQQSPTQQVQPQLHHQHQHVHGHMQGLSVDMSQVQYGGYEHVGHPQMAAHPHHAQYVHSPIQQTHPMHASDPTTSWNYLFAQFNQV